MSALFRRVRDDIAAWCRGRSWLVRLPLVLVLAWILVRHMREPRWASIVAGLNLVIHEAGHLLFGWFGELAGIAGGTVLEIAVPLAVAAAFVRQRDWFAVAVCLFWLGTVFIDVGVYAADARLRALPLVSVGGEPVHDWNYLLGEVGMLRHDRAVGALFRGLGIGAMALALGAASWMLRLMAGPAAAAPDFPEEERLTRALRGHE